MLVCPICKAYADSISHLQRHIITAHDTNLIKSFTCNQGSIPCQRTYSSLKSLYRHIIKHSQTALPTCDNQCNTTSDDDLPQESIHLESDGDDASVNLDFDINELTFILSLYAEPNLNRANVERICSAVNNLIQCKFGVKSSIFKNLDTEYKVNLARDKLAVRLEPKSFIVEYAQTFSKSDDTQNIFMKRTCAEVISISETFKTLFSVPTVLQTARNYLARAENDIMTDFKDGALAEDLPPHTFPFVLFFDELETGNALGSKKGIHKLGCIYASLRCFPTYMYSHLQNIFAIACIPSKAMSSMSEIMTAIVDEIDSLEREGILIGTEQIYFRFLGLVGDNLGQHQVLGFVGSFSANFPCISCKSHRNQCQRSIKEDSSLLRNLENYENDIELNDQSLTGVKSRCIFNRLSHYHVTENIIYDVMHDVLEGVANFGMVAVISYICDKFLCVESLDELIQNFPFRNITTKPAHIRAKDLKNNCLSQSASEMRSLTLYFSLIIGDHVPMNDEVWNYYLCLQKIVNTLLLKNISKSVIDQLDVLVAEHHELYMKLFHLNLKPKHHHMLHYKSALLKFGPLCHLWALRFEGKNHILKLFGQVTRSRTNICKSLLIRENYNFSYNILKLRSQEKMHEELECVGPGVKTSETVLEPSFKWVKRLGYKYEVGTICALKDIPCDNLLPFFCRIKHIIFRDNRFLLVVQEIDIDCYCPHSSSYKGAVLSPETYRCVSIDSISKPLIYVCKNSDYHISAMEL